MATSVAEKAPCRHALLLRLGRYCPGLASVQTVPLTRKDHAEFLIRTNTYMYVLTILYLLQASQPRHDQRIAHVLSLYYTPGT